MPTVKVNGINIYYEAHGEGEPLLMIHGTCMDSNAWPLQLSEFSKHYRVIVFDNRGIGRTDTTEPPYSISLMADDAVGLLDALGIDSAHILGFSQGGFIALDIGIRHPGRVKSLILAACAAQMNPVARYRTKLFLKMTKERVPMEFVAANMLIWSFTDRFFEDDSRAQAFISNSMNNPLPQPLKGIEGQATAVIDYDCRSRLRQITAPTLVIVGKEEILLPVRLSEEMAKNIPGARLTVLDGCGHFMIFEAPESFNKAVLEFLGSVCAK